MNSKLRNIWTPLLSKNLSNHTDVKFKLAQFLKTTDGTVLFDLRETNKGCKTSNGFSLVLSECNWLKKLLQSNDMSTHTLEHNNRVLSLDKTDYTFTVVKANGKIKKLQLNEEERKNILNFIQAFDPVTSILNENGTTIFPLKAV